MTPSEPGPAGLDLIKRDAWIFDLDNTLYPAECNLFLQVDQRMGAFIAEFLDVGLEDARKVQKDYYHRYGTTLAGLMKEHGLRPERFLDYVHDIDLAPVSPSPALAAALDALDGRKFIFTNGSRDHAVNVAGKLGVLDRFDGVFDIAASGYVPKPKLSAYERLVDAFAIDPRAAAMFEDLPHNLEMPHVLGMSTILVTSAYFDHPAQRALEDAEDLPAHIHYVTDDLVGFLAGLDPKRTDPAHIDAAH